MSLTKIAILEHEIEAQILESILLERQINYEIRAYGDDAFGNLFQMQKGWGAVYAPPNHEAEILEIIADLRNQANILDNDD